MKFGLDDAGVTAVEHERPWCAELRDNNPKEYLILATKKILNDTEVLIGSRERN